jgi:hypothetical protein
MHSKSHSKTILENKKKYLKKIHKNKNKKIFQTPSNTKNINLK